MSRRHPGRANTAPTPSPQVEATEHATDILRPNRGWFLGGAGLLAGYILDRIDAPLWLAILTLILFLGAAVVWSWLPRKPKMKSVFWWSLAIYTLFAIAISGITFYKKGNVQSRPGTDTTEIANEVIRRLPPPPDKAPPRIHLTKFEPHRPTQGERIATNVYWKNEGGPGGVYLFSNIFLHEGRPKDMEELWHIQEEYFLRMKAEHEKVKQTRVRHSVVAGGENWFTAQGPTLSRKQVEALLSRNAIAFVMGIFTYTDELQREEVEFCVCWNDGSTIYSCKEHNKEP